MYVVSLVAIVFLIALFHLSLALVLGSAILHQISPEHENIDAWVPYTGEFKHHGHEIQAALLRAVSQRSVGVLHERVLGRLLAYETNPTH